MTTLPRSLFIYAIFWLLFFLHNNAMAAARPQNDNDYSYNNGGGGVGGGGNAVDYNTFVSHFKDFFMYLPVMMTTLKESMTGFPKFAEGIRILTSKNGRLGDDADCKCNKGSSNEIENSREHYR